MRVLWLFCLTENLIYGSQFETVETSHAGCRREHSNPGRGWFLDASLGTILRNFRLTAWVSHAKPRWWTAGSNPGPLGFTSCAAATIATVWPTCAAFLRLSEFGGGGQLTRGAASPLRQTNHGSQTSIPQPPTSTLDHNYRDPTSRNNRASGAVTELTDSKLDKQLFKTHTHTHKVQNAVAELRKHATLTTVFFAETLNTPRSRLHANNTGVWQFKLTPGVATLSKLMGGGER